LIAAYNDLIGDIAPELKKSRLILVSNRLPVTVGVTEGALSMTPSGGGLATGLRGARASMGGVWIGWPGEIPGSSYRAEIEHELQKLDARPVYLTRGEQRGFYEDFSNAAIWPVFHDLIEQLPQDIVGWETYKQVNQRFAEAVATAYREGDVVWVNDYHLMLVPEMVRKLLPRAPIGFFLHIPFPPAEVFRVLPPREELLHGLLGADLVGFHTQSFLDNFVATVQPLVGARATSSGLRFGRRTVQVGVFPMGIDFATWENRARSTSVQKQVLSLMQDAGRRKIILGIDRMDYTKGLPRRIHAMERMLHADPSLAERVRFVQVAFPSRERIESYAGLRRQLNEAVGRINSTFGSPRSLPVHLVQRSFSEDEVSALYAAADIMLVTPLRDGMNLVAKEYVASRLHGDGVLVLSEFAGAAEELGGDALIVNPYDTEGLVAAIKKAIDMPVDEQMQRMNRLRELVSTHDVHHWTEQFLGALTSRGGET
jgi:trehalose 6-phosphate synthase/phosphatase